MKRYLAIIAVLIMTSFAFAQTPRDYGDTRDRNSSVAKPSEGLSVFTNLAATGINVEGVPGYVALISSSGKLFYLYIDDTNLLKIASPSQVATSASPNMVDWSNAGERVGSQ